MCQGNMSNLYCIFLTGFTPRRVGWELHNTTQQHEACAASQHQKNSVHIVQNSIYFVVKKLPGRVIPFTVNSVAVLMKGNWK